MACPDRGNLLDRKAKSFEEREQEYEKAKRRIFKDINSESIEQFWNNWHSGDGLNASNTNKNSGKHMGDAGTEDDHHPPQVICVQNEDVEWSKELHFN